MKNTALIAIPIALVVAAGTWYFLSDRTAPTNDLSFGSETNSAAVIATVDGTDITEAEVSSIETQIAAAQGIDRASLDENMNAQLREQAINEVISQTLLRKAADEANVTIEDGAVDAELAMVREQFEDEEAYEAALAAENLDETALRAQIENNLRMQAYLDQALDLDSVTVTEEEVTTFYEEQLAAAGEGAEMPPLDEVREQIEQFVLQQKQQELIAAHVQELYAEASIELHEGS